jgi:hypothetical protein
MLDSLDWNLQKSLYQQGCSLEKFYYRGLANKMKH